MITPLTPPIAGAIPEPSLTAGEISAKDAPSGRPSAARLTFSPRTSAAWAVMIRAFPAVVLKVDGAASIGAAGDRMLTFVLAMDVRYPTLSRTVPGGANTAAFARKLYWVCWVLVASVSGTFIAALLLAITTVMALICGARFK